MFKTESYGLTDIGSVRKNNEDAWEEIPEAGFYVLADGLGGHQSGEVASSKAVKNLIYAIKRIEQFKSDNRTAKELATLLRFAIKETNHHIHRMGQNSEEMTGMATTLCCLYIHQQQIIYAHVGDSRIYRLRKGRLNLLTKDHTVVNHLLNKGEITPEEARNSSYRNILTKAVGIDLTIEADVNIEEIQHDDLYLLCSDGLTDALSFHEMEEILSLSKTLKNKTSILINKAKENGGEDNITALLIKII